MRRRVLFLSAAVLTVAVFSAVLATPALACGGGSTGGYRYRHDGGLGGGYGVASLVAWYLPTATTSLLPVRRCITHRNRSTAAMGTPALPPARLRRQRIPSRGP